jgi:hypothetical protein
MLPPRCPAGMSAPRGDQGVEVPVVLAEMQQVGGGRGGGIGYRRD